MRSREVAGAGDDGRDFPPGDRIIANPLFEIGLKFSSDVGEFLADPNST
jgi:hypothetical protein